MDYSFFDLAFKEAQISYEINEVPIGCVITKNGEVIASAHNKKEIDNNCLSHAELIAITEASNKLKNWRLEGCDIYITLDPCPMCASAIKQSRISNVYSALSNSDKNNKDILNLIFRKNDSTNSRVNFFTDLSVDLSKKLLNSFFEKQRNK